MNTEKTLQAFGSDIEANIRSIKEILTAEDILVYRFETRDATECAAIYADGITDKELLGQLAAKPLAQAAAPDSRSAAKKLLLFPERKDADDVQTAVGEILSGNPVLLIDKIPGAIILGTKKAALRAIMEPQTAITVKGPREGFIEDVKTNMSLIRRRLKTPELQFETLTVGKRSATVVCLAYLDGIVDREIVRKAKARIEAVEIDGIPDSSYIAQFLADRPDSLFKQAGTTEKPDILCAKTQDYFVSPARATISRALRLLAVLVAVFLPALYVAAQLFRLQLLPFDLLMTISGSIRGIPLSPSLEMFFLLVVLEILIEASIRMPKYVALALSVIGALVLGDTAVKAGLVSSPAIIIIALSGISAYTVPDLTGTISIVRMAYLVAAGSIGTYGIPLLTGALLYYLISSDSWGVPLLAPFSPLIARDLHDSLYKAGLFSLNTRPKTLKPKNHTRLHKKESS